MMGKGFSAVEGVLDQDLGGLLMKACNKMVGSTYARVNFNHAYASHST